jgi:hypothetical protein
MAKKSKSVAQNSSTLVTEVEDVMKRIQKTSFDISFNELLDMKVSGEIDISPDFQRLFRWSIETQSRFIESLILEMPVPPIYMIEEKGGNYLLIDGLQRISSYLHLRGELDAPHLIPPIKKGEKLILKGCDIIDALNGKSFEDLSTAIQIRLKRNFIRVEVIRKGSDARFKYYMFKRLNSAGIKLTDQQIRNATIQLLDSTFNDFIKELSKEPNFMNCISIISAQQKISGLPEELVLRFFALKNNYDGFSHDVNLFLTEYMERVSEPDIKSAHKLNFDYVYEREIFAKTFFVLNSTLSDKVFGLVNKAKITKVFSVYHYEAFTIGLQDVIKKINITDSSELQEVQKVFSKIKLDSDFKKIITGGGKNSKGPLKQRIDFVRNALSAIYE